MLFPDHKKLSLGMSSHVEKMGCAWKKSGDRVNLQSMHSMFSLAVQYSICPSILPSSQSARSHVWAQYAQNHSSHWNFHPRCVMGLGVPNQLHLMILHTSIISSSEAVKGSCVSSQTAKNSQTNAQQLTADNTEGSFLSGRNPFYPTPARQLSLKAAEVERSQQVWSWEKPVRSPGVHLGGSSRCPRFWWGKKNIQQSSVVLIVVLCKFSINKTQRQKQINYKLIKIFRTTTKNCKRMLRN